MSVPAAKAVIPSAVVVVVECIKLLSKPELMLKAGNFMEKHTGEIVSLVDFRRKKETKEELGQGRNPLYVSHMQGKNAGSPHLENNESEDFGERLRRIRASLERINSIMNDLKGKKDGVQTSVH